MFVNSDFSDLLRLFNANQVKYLVIGGYALIQYAEPRYTKDLDLWINADASNAQAVYRALREFGAPLADLTAADFAQEGYFYQMGVPHDPSVVDISGSLMWSAGPGLSMKDRGLSVPFIARQDLIAANTRRPQDLLDQRYVPEDKSSKRRSCNPRAAKPNEKPVLVA